MSVQSAVLDAQVRLAFRVGGIYEFDEREKFPRSLPEHLRSSFQHVIDVKEDASVRRITSYIEEGVYSAVDDSVEALLDATSYLKCGLRRQFGPQRYHLLNSRRPRRVELTQPRQILIKWRLADTLIDRTTNAHI